VGRTASCFNGPEPTTRRAVISTYRRYTKPIRRYAHQAITRTTPMVEHRRGSRQSAGRAPAMACQFMHLEPKEACGIAPNLRTQRTDLAWYTPTPSRKPSMTRTPVLAIPTIHHHEWVDVMVTLSQWHTGGQPHISPRQPHPITVLFQGHKDSLSLFSGIKTTMIVVTSLISTASTQR
jgi:hypothetical protein